MTNLNPLFVKDIDWAEIIFNYSLVLLNGLFIRSCTGELQRQFAFPILICVLLK